MAHIQVTIAGRSYRMACGDGEEAHLLALASSLDGKIGEMRGAFGEIGDMRLHVMAALSVSDELAEERRRIDALEAEIAAMRSVAASEAERNGRADREMTHMLVTAAERIERLTRTLAGSRQAAES